MISPEEVLPQSKTLSTVKNDDFTSTTMSQQVLNTLKEIEIAIPSIAKDDVPKNDEPKKLGPKCLFLKKFQ